MLADASLCAMPGMEKKGIISSQGIGGVVTKDDDPDAIFYGVRLDDGREIEVCVKSDDVDFL